MAKKKREKNKTNKNTRAKEINRRDSVPINSKLNRH
jgi:hypothetical protein